MLDFDHIEARGLTKLYGPTRALVSATLTVRAGDVCVVEGPNGSGKTTLVSLLALLARPSRGELRFGEHDGREARRELVGRIGYLGHRAAMYPGLSGRENLHFFGELREVPNLGARVDAAIERFDAKSFAGKPLGKLSRGQMQRLALGLSVLHEPRLLVLDEPTTGLDARSIETLAAVIAEEKARGAIVLVVTHDEAFAEAVATRRVRMDRGKIASDEAAR